MSNIFLLLFFLSIIGLVAGLIRPQLISKVLKRSLPRKKTGLIFGTLAILFFILTGIMAPPTKVASDQVKKEEQPQPTSSGNPQTTPNPTPTQSPSTTPTSTPTKSGETFRVVKVIDGDTINVDINGKVETLRLIGIDTPETVDPRKPVQCFGIEASNKAKGVLNGQSVRLEADNTQGERDKYNRLLRYVFLLDGTNFNKLMISEGYAHEYTYQSNPYKYQTEFKQAEKEARENKRGLWADNACEGTSIKSTYQTPATNNTSGSCKYSCSGPDKDCSDFSTHNEAQAFFNCCGFSATNDPMKLDSVGVGDGIACESLP